MKKLIITSVLLLIMAVYASNAVAQSQGADVTVKQIDKVVQLDKNDFYLSDELTGVFTNSTFIGGIQQLAMDANQVARINTVGDNNTATLKQFGNSNIGIINIDGSGNNATLKQDGDRLFSAIKLLGNFNTLDVAQDGNDLQNVILLEGRGLAFDIDQTPRGTQIQQLNSSVPLMISTSSTTVPIIIRNN